MKNLRIGLLLMTVAAAACADGMHEPSRPMVDGSHAPSVEVGGDYAVARTAIVTAGWTAVPARCSETNLCSEYVELATDLDSGNTCGHFIKEGKVMDVCVDVIPDGARLKSISTGVRP